MPALMFDSDNPAVLLTPAAEGCRIATYADLLTPSIVAAAGPRLLVIDRGSGDPLGKATIADIEPGILSVAEGAAKIRQWISEGRRYPTAYHDRNLAADVSGALAGVHYWTWLATLDGTVDPAGYTAHVVQAFPSTAIGFHADMSIVWDDAWNPLPSGPAAAAVLAVKQAAARALAPLTALEQAITRL